MTEADRTAVRLESLEEQSAVLQSFAMCLQSSSR
jgi:hypothetical protein